MALDPNIALASKGLTFNLGDILTQATQRQATQQNTAAQAQQMQAQAKAEQVAEAKRKSDLVVQALQGVTDEPSFQAAKQQIASVVGPQATDAALGQSYNPAIVNQVKASHMQAHDFLTQQNDAAMQGYRQQEVGIQKETGERADRRAEQLAAQQKSALDAATARDALTAENVRADNVRADAAAKASADAQRLADERARAVAAETGRHNLATEAAAAAALKDKNSPIDIRPDVQTTATGKKYLDLSLYQGETRNRALKAAGDAGIPAVSKEDSDTLKVIDNARLSQKDILAQVQTLLPKDSTGRVFGAPARKLSTVFQTDEQRAAFNTWRAAAIQTLKATAGAKGLRINQAEIAQAVENDIPTLNDTLGVAATKNANINKMLDNAESPIVDRDRSAPGAGKTAPATGITVTAPKTGKPYTLKDQAAADAFVAAAKAKGLW